MMLLILGFTSIVAGISSKLEPASRYGVGMRKIEKYQMFLELISARNRVIVRCASMFASHREIRLRLVISPGRCEDAGRTCFSADSNGGFKNAYYLRPHCARSRRRHPHPLGDIRLQLVDNRHIIIMSLKFSRPT